MDLSTNDVLFLLGVVELAACVGCALYWLIGRDSAARPARQARRTTRPAPARSTPAVSAPAVSIPAVSIPAPSRQVPDEVSDTGRHHVPDELLHSTTYRLPADRRARARVPEPASGPLYQVPGQAGRTAADQFSDAG